MNKPLPSARLISSSMVADVNIPDEKYTLAFMQWAQLLEHDLSHIPMRKMSKLFSLCFLIITHYLFLFIGFISYNFIHSSFAKSNQLL